MLCRAGHVPDHGLCSGGVINVVPWWAWTRPGTRPPSKSSCWTRRWYSPRVSRTGRFVSNQLADFWLLMRCGFNVSAWFEAVVVFFMELYIRSAHMRSKYLTATSCQANMTGDGSHCWGWWIVYYLPAVKQQTSICSYIHNKRAAFMDLNISG